MTSRGGRAYRRLFRLPFGRQREGDEIDEEVAFHLARKAEKLEAAGMPRAEAEAEARRRFGDVDAVTRSMRETRRRSEAKMRRSEGWDGLRQDSRFAVRHLAKNPVFTAVVVITVALGVGVNTAIFSIVDGILFRPLPFPEPQELMALWSDVTERGGPDDEWLSYANFRDIADGVGSLEAASAWGGTTGTLTGFGDPQQLPGAVVTYGMFSRVLDVEPLLGRDFTEEDHRPGTGGAIILSEGLWRTVMGGDRSILGSTVTMNDVPVTVVGVMPSDFTPPFVPNASYWTADQSEPAAQAGRRGGFSWQVIARLGDDVSLDRATTELDAFGARLERAYPESNTDMGFRLVPLHEDLVAAARTPLLLLLAAVGLVLLVACANVANLLLARSSSRVGELAVRSALGAGSRRIFSQLLTESLVLSVVGGVLGIALALVGTKILVGLAPDGTPRLDAIAVDGRVLAFSAAVTVFSGVLFGVLPSLRLSRRDLRDALREGGRGLQGASGGRRVRSTLVVTQVALALTLLVGAGLLLRTFRNLRSEDLGYRPQDVLTVQLNLPRTRYPDADALRPFYHELEERLAAIPGVEGVALTNTVPLMGFNGDVSFFVEGREIPPPGQEDAVWFRRVTPSYHDVMRIPILEGRAFTAADNADSERVVIINETLARRMFPDESPIGRRLTFNPDDPTWRVIVGVAGDVRNFGIREGSRYALYSPYDQTPSSAVFPVIRTALPSADVVSSVRRQVAEMDGSLAVGRVQTLESLVTNDIGPERVVAALLSLFAVVALLLAAVGLYGVVSYGVASRLREMGIRIAMGAGAGEIGRLVVGGSVALVGLGVVIGLAAAYSGATLIEGLLFGVDGADPVTLSFVIVTLVVTAVVASVVPARRAILVDPIEVLRTE